MKNPSERTWQIIGAIFSDNSHVDITVKFNTSQFNFNVVTDFSFEDYNVRWNELMGDISINRKVLAEFNMPYSMHGNIPLEICLNTPGKLIYSNIKCNYTVASVDTYTDPKITFGSSCGIYVSEKRFCTESDKYSENRINVFVDGYPIEARDRGWEYHITNLGSPGHLSCNIKVDKTYITRYSLPAVVERQFDESYVHSYLMRKNT